MEIIGRALEILIDCRDQVINLCEVKFSINKFTIFKTSSEAIRNKIAVFSAQTATTKPVFSDIYYHIWIEGE